MSTFHVIPRGSKVIIQNRGEYALYVSDSAHADTLDTLNVLPDQDCVIDASMKDYFVVAKMYDQHVSVDNTYTSVYGTVMTVSVQDWLGVNKNATKAVYKPYCNHLWQETILMYSKVYDCKHCGVKREDIDASGK